MILDENAKPDELRVNPTPKSIRLRKALLDPHERKKAGRKKEAV